MIIKVTHSIKDNRMYITSKPSHSGRDKQHSVEYEDKPTQGMLDIMRGKTVAYFHAHMKEDALVLDDMIDDQHW